MGDLVEAEVIDKVGVAIPKFFIRSNLWETLLSLTQAAPSVPEPSPDQAMGA